MDLGIPDPPLNLTAEAASAFSVELSWKDNSNNETYFVIERKTGDGDFTQVDTVAANVTSYNDSSVSPNTAYTYRVKAKNGGFALTSSNVAGVTTPALTLSLSRLSGEGKVDNIIRPQSNRF